MAVFTDIGRLGMCRVLTGCVRTVMAADTVTGNVDVIEIRGYPGDRAVTVIAVVAAGDVCRVLASSTDAVVAGATSTKNLGVIDHYHGHEHSRGMAVFTDIGRLRVCRVLAGCVRAVMAVDAATGDGRMIEGRR